MKLAVFSACATAQASEVSESNSLVSRFLQAGAQNVVASRWNVDSIATSGFIDHFYQSLLSGQSVAEALQSSASAFRQGRERVHPYYWAAFAAFGSS
jgi:CHAT domain-containing protein